MTRRGDLKAMSPLKKGFSVGGVSRVGLLTERGQRTSPRRVTVGMKPLADAKAAGAPTASVDGLLDQMTKAVLERALQIEMTHHLDYDRDGTRQDRSSEGLQKLKCRGLAC